MSKGLFDLPPTQADVSIAKAAFRMARPREERALGVATWLADEKLMLSAVALFWLWARTRSKSEAVKKEADRMLISVGIAGLLPDVFKKLVNRKRPDRAVVHGPRHGIPRSGDALDSFPSGHALHVGAIAGPLLRLTPGEGRPAVLMVLGALAATRVLLLAHYVTDVVAGLALGAGIGSAVTALTKPAKRS
jgi:membrane-associated phospholipid phosphatase